MRHKDPNRYPKGWNGKRVRALIKHYENQSDDTAIAEAEAAYKKRRTAVIEVPLKLLPQVRRILARAG